jgi:hypothetical protein
MNPTDGNEPIKGKPLGIVIISVLTGLLAVLHLSNGSPIIPLFAFAAIYGFWTYQKWGYRLMIAVYILQIIAFASFGYNDFAAQFSGKRLKGLFEGIIIGIVIAGPVIFYLSTAKIRSFFDNK